MLVILLSNVHALKLNPTTASSLRKGGSGYRGDGGGYSGGYGGYYSGYGNESGSNMPDGLKIALGVITVLVIVGCCCLGCS